ncbi:hypothetical protein TSL1_17870 [Sulfurovum sp. TSL1]|nr:hypothetical protein TSL1_17870 [Sulfurovum sp. TSL1]
MPAIFSSLFVAGVYSPLAPIKACHCNCFFKLKTRMTLLLNHYIPRCPFYCTYFAFRRTGVHPPFTILSK